MKDFTRGLIQDLDKFRIESDELKLHYKEVYEAIENNLSESVLEAFSELVEHLDKDNELAVVSVTLNWEPRWKNRVPWYEADENSFDPCWRIRYASSGVCGDRDQTMENIIVNETPEFDTIEQALEYANKQCWVVSAVNKGYWSQVEEQNEIVRRQKLSKKFKDDFGR